MSGRHFGRYSLLIGAAHTAAAFGTDWVGKHRIGRWRSGDLNLLFHEHPSLGRK
ncbi:hypothetical protein JRQ81_017616 [Phrynocephalus forsythii]|uniref:Uncharacterized protein n=1 Tax=Phrynocephalus forsythii TaxID=171643 RepID=A0A9Q1B0C7_9SAUR|nr:hypothetical protein JRQ81_017616 [Phrynocephalus forsythii]